MNEKAQFSIEFLLIIFALFVVFISLSTFHENLKNAVNETILYMQLKEKAYVMKDLLIAYKLIEDFNGYISLKLGEIKDLTGNSLDCNVSVKDGNIEIKTAGNISYIEQYNYDFNKDVSFSNVCIANDVVLQ